MKTLLVFCLSLWFHYFSYGQISFVKDNHNNDIIEVTIDNIIKIMELPSSEFKSIIISKGYNLSTVEDDCNNFVKGSSLDGTIHGLGKCSLYSFSIGWFSLEDGKSNISLFIDEIEKYYAGYDNNMELSFYQVKRNNLIYKFYISRSKETESVFCTRFN